MMLATMMAVTFVGCNKDDDDKANPTIIISTNEITVDLDNLTDFQAIEVSVNAAEELTSIKVAIQAAGAEIYVVEEVTTFDKGATGWTQTYTLADFPSITLIEPLKDSDLMFCIEAKTKDTEAAKSVPITVVEPINPDTPLEGPKGFTWDRVAPKDGTGLAEFGLAWTSNTDSKIVITPLTGTTLVQLEETDWTITTMEKLKELVDKGTPLSKWEVIPTKVTFNHVIATKTADGKYFLINPTSMVVDTNDGGHRTVTGEYKY